MDNLTHTLTGLAIARAGLGKYTSRGTLLLIVASNIPDIDMLSWVEGRLRMLEIHRGYLHSLLLMPVMAAAAVLVTALLGRSRVRWAAAWLIAMVGVASHLLLDWSMSYGIRLLLPFSSKWYALDLFGLTDWVILGALGLAWIGPMLGRLVSEEIGAQKRSGRGPAIAALLFFIAYGGFRVAMHSRVMSQLESRIYYTALEGPATRMAAFPEPGNPLAWNAIVEGEYAYRLYEVSALGNFDPAEGTLLYKHEWTPLIEKVSRAEAFRYLLYFSRFPYWQDTPSGDGHEVSVTDLRFGLPGNSFFRVSAQVDAAGRIDAATLGGR